MKEFQLAAARLIGSFHFVLQRAPAALPQMFAAMDATITEPMQIVIAGTQTSAAELLKVVAQSYQPAKMFSMRTAAKTRSSSPSTSLRLQIWPRSTAKQPHMSAAILRAMFR